MSHFAVAVIHHENQSVDELLAPYDENLAVEPYIAYTRQQAIDYVKKYYSPEFVEGKTDEELWEAMAEGCETDEEQNIYSTYNPDSKWDWYQEGGRWGGLLKIKNNAIGRYHGSKTADEAFVEDVDFSPDNAEYKAALRFWDVVVGGQEKEPGEEIFNIYKPEYYLQYYGDRETYAKRSAQWSTFAVVTPDGVWHEKGQMGWFGCSSATPDGSANWDENYMARFIHAADPHDVITIVDCHI